MTSHFAANLLIAYLIGGSISFMFVVALPPIERRLRRFVVPIRAVAAIAGTAVGVAIGCTLIAWVSAELGRSYPRAAVLGVAIPVAAAVVFFGEVFDRLKERAHAMQLRQRETDDRLVRARLDALQARLNPHFLFNSLNTIAALIAEDRQQAELAVVRLSQLLRYTLDGSKRSLVPLEEELNATLEYLSFEQLRFEERLRVAVEIDPAARQIPVPPLTLQPLVENAVHHGVSSRKGGGSVRIEAQLSDGMLELVVEDDGPGPDGSSHQGTKSAHADLRERLRLAFGDGANLDTGRGSLGGYAARVRIPATTTIAGNE